ncbi:cysteine desulfurase NifS [Thermodesulfobium narugense DSM 14796]|uniref:Cysteine desulfurase IscS n=1 Tax=Thermodesulfobium narugense DSM 14796 TaxID=747365 RepID=M1E834_9BACT|nr:cysteine desulfurase NifS [Thermodesulfobium narugense]AEE14735.1 cysteine desulfurase NifS [Thermodesulfobium narugense DSM 14796]
MKKSIYMDYAATTFVRQEVLDEILPYFKDYYSNPSSLYSFAEDSKKAIKLARQRVASVINSKEEEIYFTSGGSESDNWAIKGIAFANKDKGNHIITSQIEHHAVLNAAKFLEKNGFTVTYLPVDSDGFIKLEDLRNAITDKTILVSIMFANNEIGTIEPISEIGKLCKEKGVYFHTDAVQVVGHLPIDVESMNIDLLSMSGHKFYGPKGVGVLYVKKGVKIENLIHGGAQEKGKRASTENVPGIVGLGKAIEIAQSEQNFEIKRLTALRDKLIDGILNKVSNTKLNGPTGNLRLPNNVNISFLGVEGETLLFDLDDAGVFVSTGSACASGSLEPSHVLLSIGLSHELAHGSIRLTLGLNTTEEDVDYVLEILPKIIEKRRAMSPIWSEIVRKEEKISCTAKR